MACRPVLDQRFTTWYRRAERSHVNGRFVSRSAARTATAPTHPTTVAGREHQFNERSEATGVNAVTTESDRCSHRGWLRRSQTSMSPQHRPSYELDIRVGRRLCNDAPGVRAFPSSIATRESCGQVRRYARLQDVDVICRLACSMSGMAMLLAYITKRRRLSTRPHVRYRT